MKSIIYIIAFLFAVCGCVNRSTSQDDISNEKLISMARTSIMQAYPDDISNYKAKVYDRDDYWVVIFTNPSHRDDVITIGGELVAHIDKKTMNLIRIYKSQ